PCVIDHSLLFLPPPVANGWCCLPYAPQASPPALVSASPVSPHAHGRAVDILIIGCSSIEIYDSAHTLSFSTPYQRHSSMHHGLCLETTVMCGLAIGFTLHRGGTANFPEIKVVSCGLHAVFKPLPCLQYGSGARLHLPPVA